MNPEAMDRQREKRVLNSIIERLEDRTMTVDKLRSLFTFYKDHLMVLGYRPIENKVDDSQKTYQMNHCCWMCEQCIKENGFIEEGRIEKAMRWLGYVQGMLRAFGVFKLEDLKTHSRSE